MRVLGIVARRHHVFLAKEIRVRHFSKGAELPNIVRNRKYNVRENQFNLLKHEVSVSPGDELTIGNFNIYSTL
jgi:hypothetical protein